MNVKCLTRITADRIYEIGEILNIDDPSQLLSVGAVEIVEEKKSEPEKKEEKKKPK